MKTLIILTAALISGAAYGQLYSDETLNSPFISPAAREMLRKQNEQYVQWEKKNEQEQAELQARSDELKRAIKEDDEKIQQLDAQIARDEQNYENAQRHAEAAQQHLDAAYAQAYIEARDAARDLDEALRALDPPQPVPVYIIPNPNVWHPNNWTTRCATSWNN